MDNDYIMADCYIKFYSHFNKHFVISISIRIKFCASKKIEWLFRHREMFTIYNFEWQTQTQRHRKRTKEMESSF